MRNIELLGSIKPMVMYMYTHVHARHLGQIQRYIRYDIGLGKLISTTGNIKLVHKNITRS